MADTAAPSTLSTIFGTANGLIGLGSQSLTNDAERIKTQAAQALSVLNNQHDLSAQQFAVEAAKIQTDRDTALSLIKIQQRKQTYAAVGLIVGALAVVGVVVLLIVRSKKP